MTGFRFVIASGPVIAGVAWPVSSLRALRRAQDRLKRGNPRSPEGMDCHVATRLAMTVAAYVAVGMANEGG